MFSFTFEDLILMIEGIAWGSIIEAAWRPAISGLAGLIGGAIAARIIAMKERNKRGGGFWYDRVTIARYVKLADGTWFKDSMGGLNLESLFKSPLNAKAIIRGTNALGMDRESPLYQHVRDILFQEASDRLGRHDAQGIHCLTFRKNDRGDGSRGNLEVILTPLALWNRLKSSEELPEVVVGPNHLEAMKECALASPPDWFIACKLKDASEFRVQGFGVMKADSAPS
jgi:hypothetical protein